MQSNSASYKIHWSFHRGDKLMWQVLASETSVSQLFVVWCSESLRNACLPCVSVAPLVPISSAVAATLSRPNIKQKPGHKVIAAAVLRGPVVKSSRGYFARELISLPVDTPSTAPSGRMASHQAPGPSLWRCVHVLLCGGGVQEVVNVSESHASELYMPCLLLRGH